jgi:hypothetical protein
VKLRLLAAVLALFAGTAAATTYELDLREIPDDFHGLWDVSPRSCAIAGRTRLEVSAAQLRFGGDRFNVSAVSILEDNHIGISSDHVGPGNRWGRTDHFTLSRDGTTLTARRGGRAVVRRRCPESRLGSE